MAFAFSVSRASDIGSIQSCCAALVRNITDLIVNTFHTITFGDDSSLLYPMVRGQYLLEDELPQRLIKWRDADVFIGMRYLGRSPVYAILGARLNSIDTMVVRGVSVYLAYIRDYVSEVELDTRLCRIRSMTDKLLSENVIIDTNNERDVEAIVALGLTYENIGSGFLAVNAKDGIDNTLLKIRQVRLGLLHPKDVISTA